MCSRSGTDKDVGLRNRKGRGIKCKVEEPEKIYDLKYSGKNKEPGSGRRTTDLVKRWEK